MADNKTFAKTDIDKENLQADLGNVNPVTGGLELSAGGPRVLTGTGAPNGAISAPVGSIYLRSDGGPNAAFYMKEVGTGTTGWTAHTTAQPAPSKVPEGHWISIWQNSQGPSHFQTFVDTYGSGVTGFLVRVQWKDLETSEGVYSKTLIQQWLDYWGYLNGRNKLVIFMVEDKTFGDGAGNPMPAYLNNYDSTGFYDPPVNTGPSHTYGNGISLKNTYATNSRTAQRWHPRYVERMTALVNYYQSEFDLHPNFMGMAIQESALGLSGTVTNGTTVINGIVYDPVVYKDAMVQVWTDTLSTRPNSWLFPYINFITGGYAQMNAIIGEAAGLRCVLGGPDLFKKALSFDNDIYGRYSGIYRVSGSNWELYTQGDNCFESNIPSFQAFQQDSFRQFNDGVIWQTSADNTRNVPYFGLQEMFDFSIGKTVKSSMIIWTYIDSQNITDNVAPYSSNTIWNAGPVMTGTPTWVRNSNMTPTDGDPY